MAAAPSFSRWEWLLAAALVVVIFLVYQPAWQGGFIWDDDVHLLNNPVLQPGGLAKIWVPGSFVNYWPLTFSVYRFEFEMWGLKPIGFHLVNILLHALSALLVWRILTHLRVPGAMFAAALFALHPVNVESVAWITQLKNVLSLPLTLLSVLFYLHYEKRGERWRYAVAVGLFFLSTLAKGMALTLPVVLLACAWWQRGSHPKARSVARRSLHINRRDHGPHGGVVAAPVRGPARCAFRQPPESNRRGRLCRVVLPLEADLAG